MNEFKNFGIKPASQGMIGDKIKIDRILNREIMVSGYSIKDSRYDGKCLTMQIIIGETKHIVFTGSTVLLDTIQQVPKERFPFKTTIVKENERFEFT